MNQEGLMGSLRFDGFSDGSCKGLICFTSLELYVRLLF